jgi:hypothetical protein
VAEESPQAPSKIALPPRPREVRLDGVDPCSLLTPEQRITLGVRSQPSASKPYVELFHGEVPTCTMYGSSPGAFILGIGTVTTAGIERWQDRSLAAQIHPAVVAGFPAVIAVPKQSQLYCAIEVDVANGQLLDVQVLDGGDEPQVPQHDLCTIADRSAEQMTASLLAR